VPGTRPVSGPDAAAAATGCRLLLPPPAAAVYCCCCCRRRLLPLSATAAAVCRRRLLPAAAAVCCLCRTLLLPPPAAAGVLGPSRGAVQAARQAGDLPPTDARHPPRLQGRRALQGVGHAAVGALSQGKKELLHRPGMQQQAAGGWSMAAAVWLESSPSRLGLPAA
jgi:hypothetical protein